MTELRCAVPGCREMFRTNEPLHANARFICKNHPRKTQVETAGRVYHPEADHKDEAVHFQDVQFDREIGDAIEPLRNDSGELCSDRRRIPARPKAA
jgi:hypothetical protein